MFELLVKMMNGDYINKDMFIFILNLSFNCCVFFLLLYYFGYILFKIYVKIRLMFLK